MKYLTDKPFSVGGYSEQGGKEYDRIFKKKRNLASTRAEKSRGPVEAASRAPRSALGTDRLATTPPPRGAQEGGTSNSHEEK